MKNSDSKESPLVLLLTDFSEASRAAYPVCASLCERLGARVELLHVVPETWVAPTGVAPIAVAPVDPEVRRRACEGDLATERELLPAELAVTTRSIVASDVASGVAEHTADVGADLVALASHGRSGLGRALFGSVAESVMRASATPLLVVPTG